ncbi:hypothetical protein V8G54_030328, partial [Vigna mungo]
EQLRVTPLPLRFFESSHRDGPPAPSKPSPVTADTTRTMAGYGVTNLFPFCTNLGWGSHTTASIRRPPFLSGQPGRRRRPHATGTPINHGGRFSSQASLRVRENVLSPRDAPTAAARHQRLRRLLHIVTGEIYDAPTQPTKSITAIALTDSNLSIPENVASKQNTLLPLS